jgi:PAS domain S-box-containing protein
MLSGLRPVLVLDDDILAQPRLHDALLASGCRVALPGKPCSDGELLDLIRRERIRIAVLDLLRGDDGDGLETLAKIVFNAPDVSVIVTADTEENQYAIDALKLGAWDYLVKPIEDASLLEHALIRALERSMLLAENAQHRLRQESEGALRSQEGDKSPLLERRNLLQALVESLPYPVFYKNIHGEYQICNKAFCEMLGVERERVLGQTAHAFFPSELGASFDASDMNVLHEGGVETYSYDFRLPNGDLRRMLSSKSAFRDADGRTLGMVGAITDITEQKQAEEKLEAMNRRLESLVAMRTALIRDKAQELEAANQRLLELDEMKSSFLATVSHDLRTPLTSIYGFVRLVRSSFEKHFLGFADGAEALEKKGKRIKQNLGIVEREIQRLNRLINDFLDLAKIEAGKAEWRDVETSIKSFVQDAVAAVSGQLALKPALSLETALAPDLPSLRVDPDRLIQALVNLLGNAIKFTSKGLVSLRVTREQDGCVRFETRDTGPGLSETQLPYIFDRFQQARRHELGGQPGSGLGLSICREIVEHYGGRIWVESVAGQGSSFYFTLPASIIC